MNTGHLAGLAAVVDASGEGVYFDALVEEREEVGDGGVIGSGVAGAPTRVDCNAEITEDLGDLETDRVVEGTMSIQRPQRGNRRYSMRSMDVSS